MAETQINDCCGICKKPLVGGDSTAIYITKVKLTETPAHYWQRLNDLPDGKLRIKHMGNSKPKVCVHISCFDSVIKPLLAE